MAKNKRNGKPIKQDLEDQQKAFEDFFHNELPLELIMMAEENIDESFMKEQYQDGKSSKWAPRKNDKEADKSREERRGLMVKSGDLHASFEADQDGTSIVIGTDKVYAQIHNEGLQGTAFGKHSFKMPKRQMMPIPGEEPPFQDKADKFIDDKMDQIFE